MNTRCNADRTQSNFGSVSKEAEFLRGTVPYEFSFPHGNFQKIYRDKIAGEVVAFEEDHLRRHGGAPGIKKVESFRRDVEKKYSDQHERNRERVLLWQRSERILDLLRTKGMLPSGNVVGNENFGVFVKTINPAVFPEIDPASPFYMGENTAEIPPTITPNHYFEATQPKLVGLYGPAFFTAIATETAQRSNHYQPDTTQTERITGINTMFWAAFLCGDQRLQHEVIYYVPDQTFYFFDLRAGCFVPTSEAKLTLSLSLWIQQCSYGQPMETAKLILEKCRTKTAIKEIIDLATTILAADAGFFQGAGARQRWRSNREADPDATVDPAAIRFVEDQIEPAEGAILPVKAVLERYRLCSCRSALSERVLRRQIEQAVDTVHGRTPRNDLRQPNGSCVASWKGLSLRVSPEPTEDFATIDFGRPSSVVPVPPGLSGPTGDTANVPMPAHDVVLLN